MGKPYAATGGKPIFHEFKTPIGLFTHCYHDTPSLKTHEHTKQPILDDNGIQEAEFKVTLAWSKTRINELQGLIDLANTVRAEAWPESTLPQAFFALQPFFRDGDNPEHNTKNREYLHGRYYLNFKQKAIGQRDPQTGRVTYSGGPGYCGPYGPEDKLMPTDVYAGITGIVSGIMFATEYMGKHFISTRLNNIQKYEDGDRIGGGGRPTVEDQFIPLKTGGPAIGGGLGGLGGLAVPATKIL